jgi:hypothetical protein
MDKNFSIANAVAIRVGNDECDLHNDFDLTLLEVDLARRNLRLTFTWAIEAAAPNRNRHLTLAFNEVEFLNVSGGVLGKMVRDVVELGYKSPEDFDHDWLMRERQASPPDHLFVRLAGDEFIRVHSRSALAQFGDCASN